MDPDSPYLSYIAPLLVWCYTCTVCLLMCKINVWLELEEPDIVSVLCQLTQLESRMVSIPFPAGGNLYYTNDLEKMAGRTGIPLNDGHFCVGVDVRLHM